MRTGWALVAALLSVLGANAGMELSRASATGRCPASAGDRDYGLAVLRDPVKLSRGSSAEVPVCISRTEGFDAPVVVELELLPDGVESEPVTIPASGTTGVLRVVAGRYARLGGLAPAVVVAGAWGHIHTAPVLVRVQGTPDSHIGPPESDEGKAALAVLRSMH